MESTPEPTDPAALFLAAIKDELEHPRGPGIPAAMLAEMLGATASAAGVDPPDIKPIVPPMAKALRRMVRTGEFAGPAAEGMVALALALETLPTSWLSCSLAMQAAVMLMGPEECGCYDSAEARWAAAHADALNAVFARVRALAAEEDGRAAAGRRPGLIARLCGWAAATWGSSPGRGSG